MKRLVEEVLQEWDCQQPSATGQQGHCTPSADTLLLVLTRIYSLQNPGPMDGPVDVFIHAAAPRLKAQHNPLLHSPFCGIVSIPDKLEPLGTLDLRFDGRRDRFTVKFYRHPAGCVAEIFHRQENGITSGECLSHFLTQANQ